jgi:pyruvate dehydrogenase E2 component (dihydrolipoyllysine-residue acetyltransferase)
VTASKVVLAKLSPTMEEGTIVKWTKNEGDAVKQGDVLAEIETDKANMEMEAQAGGVLRKILVPAGGKAPVGALIGVIAEPGDDISAMLAKAGAGAQPAAKPAAAAPQPKPAAPAPAPQAAAPQPQPAPAAAQPAPASPRPAPAPQPAAAPPPQAEGGRVKASPLARNIAAQHNIALSTVAGTGPGGRIVKRDLEAYGAAAQAPAAAAATPAPAPGPRPFAAPAPAVQAGQELPLSNMRKTIAKRLSESMFTAPHFYVTMEIDMGPAVALRDQLLRGDDVKVSFNDLVVKACAKALTRFPMVNASWMGDKIVTHGEVHVGIAVAIPDGLITPVVRNADRKSVVDISREVKDLAGRARDRKLKLDEFSGSTFTVSNLGMMDVTEFTAIINPPESAILAVGAVRKVPVVAGDEITIGHRMNVTMSSDHRVVDGALAAQFLKEVRRLLENPVSLFV